MTSDSQIRMTDEDAEKFQDLADQIYALATTLHKRERHLISNAANLIRWVAYDAAKPGDPESAEAIAKLRSALSPKDPT